MKFDLINGSLTLTASFGAQKLLYAIPSDSDNNNVPYTTFDLSLGSEEEGVILRIEDISPDVKHLVITQGKVVGDFDYYIAEPGDNSWTNIRLDAATNSILVYSVEHIEDNRPECTPSEALATSSVCTRLYTVNLGSKKEVGIRSSDNTLIMTTV